MMDVCAVGRDDGCLLSGGEGVRGVVIFTFFLAGLVGRGLMGFWRFLALPFLGRVSLNFPPQPRVLLPKRFHLISIALLQVEEFLLHLGLAFKDGGQVWGCVCRHSKACLKVLHDSSSTTGGNYSRQCSDCWVNYYFMPHGGCQLFLRR